MAIKNITDIPELTEAVGNETIVGVSNGKVVRIPVDSIGGGSVEPVVLRAKSSDTLKDYNTVYADGSEVNFNDIKAAFLNGIPILIGYSKVGTGEISLNNTIYRVIAVGLSSIYVIIETGTVKSIKL